MKKIKIFLYVIIVTIFLWLIIDIVIPEIEMEFAMKKYAKEYYGLDNIEVVHDLLYGTYGIINGDDTISYNNGMIFDYQRYDNKDLLSKKLNDIICNMDNIVSRYSDVHMGFPLDDIHTPHYILKLQVSNYNDISGSESKNRAVSFAMEIAEKMSNECNVIGIYYDYADQHSCYEADVVYKKPITYEMIDKAIKLDCDHENPKNHSEWFWYVDE